MNLWLLTHMHFYSVGWKGFLNINIENFAWPEKVMQDKSNEECSSYTSSNRESWGRCSSLGSADEPTTDCTTSGGSSLQIALWIILTCPVAHLQYTLCEDWHLVLQILYC